MDRLRVPVWLCAFTCLAGCAAPETAATAKPPRRALAIESYPDNGSVKHQDAWIHFGFEREAPPPGFVPSPAPAKEADHYTGLGHMAGKGGVKTLIPLDDVGPVGRVEHYDASAPLYISQIAPAASLRSATVFVPIVGPNGERLTRVYEYLGPKAEFDGTRATFTALGSGPIPRVTRLVTPSWSDDSRGFVYVAVTGSEDGKPLYLPVSKKGVIVQPAGVVGARTLGSEPSPTTIGDWAWWLVRWKGAAGEGWSLSQKALLSDVGAGPEWSKVQDKTFPGAAAFLGERKDGHCDAFVHHTDGGIPMAFLKNADTCEAALPALVQLQNKVAADTKAANAATQAAAKDKERAEVIAANEKRRKDEEAKLEAERKASGERWRKQEKEAPALKKYAELVRAGKTDEACKEATAGLATDTHANLVIGRREEKDFSPAEGDCVRARLSKSTTAEDRALSERVLTAVERRGNHLPGGGGGGASAPASGQGHEDFIKRANDYTHGSGRASSCPFSDRSLCK